MIKQLDITGIVLCGGKGSRLGGQDKPLIYLDRRRIIEHVSERLSDQVAQIIISCSRNVALYECFDYPLAVDSELEQGPLAGLCEAFRHTKTEWALTTPGDTPFLSRKLTSHLVETAEIQGVAVPIVDGVKQNLCLLINSFRREQLMSFHQAGGEAVKDWLDEIQIAPTELTEINKTFFNINTVAELEEAKRRIKVS